MARGQTTAKIDEAQWRIFRKALAAGLVNMAGTIDGEAKLNTPVHGDASQGQGFKTFVPGEKPIGGTLRRSIHHVVYIDGQRMFSGGELSGSVTKDDGTVVTWSEVGDHRRGIEAFVGTNVFYAKFVHDGTVKMEARPFLQFAYLNVRGKLEGAFRDGFNRIMPR